MSQTGKSHLVIMWTVGPDDVAEGDRIFASHVGFAVATAPVAARRRTAHRCGFSL
jgi:hypothetical protein